MAPILATVRSPIWQTSRGAALRGAGLGVAAVILAPMVLDTYLVNILVRACFIAIAAITVDIVWGYCGTLTFGQSAFFGIGAYAIAICFSQYGFGSWQMGLALAAALAVAAGLGLLTGWLSYFPGSTPLYASIVSLVVPIVVVQLLYSGGTFTGSSSGLVGFETIDLEVDTWLRLAGLLLICIMMLALCVMRSDAGRLLRALRDNEMRSTYLGLNTSRIRIVVLVTCAGLAALAGAGYTAFGGVAAPEIASFTFGTKLVIMVALGGRSTVIGAVVGALALEVASAFLSGSLPYVWELIVGLALIIVILVFPDGLMGALKRLRPASSAPARRPTRIRAVPSQSLTRAGNEIAISVQALGKHYGSLSVLDGVSFEARRGELVSLVGPNGAGKTTLIKCLSDGRERSSGTVAIAGRDIGKLPAFKIVRLGLARKFQTALVFDTLTVADCLMVARANLQSPSLFTLSRELALPPAAIKLVERSGLAEHLDVKTQALSHGLKQALELAMVLALEPDVVLLDEPTAGLSLVERQAFAELFSDLIRRDGLCVLLVEHDLDFVREISSRIIVLHQGRIALDGSVSEVANSTLVREIYTGASSRIGA